MIIWGVPAAHTQDSKQTTAGLLACWQAIGRERVESWINMGMAAEWLRQRQLLNFEAAVLSDYYDDYWNRT